MEGAGDTMSTELAATIRCFTRQIEIASLRRSNAEHYRTQRVRVRRQSRRIDRFLLTNITPNSTVALLTSSCPHRTRKT